MYPTDFRKACIDAVRSMARPNCSDHTPYRGACVTCGRSDNPMVLPSPDEVVARLEALSVAVGRKDLEAMVCGRWPAYSRMDDPLVKSCGQYVGGMRDEWNWDRNATLTDEELWRLYNIVKA